jgi:glycosyltransferase involved in cell wall biosynthesis
MKLVVITTGSYPYGGAATNRHVSYLKGLVELGIKVHLLILQKDNHQSNLSNKSTGVFQGIQFEYATWHSTSDAHLFFKIFNKLKALWVAKKKLIRIIEDSEPDLRLLILTTKPVETYPFLKVAKKKGMPSFHERTEYPFLNSKSFFQKAELSYYLKYIIPKFDGIFVITHALAEYFKPFLSANQKIMVLPMTVDFERFTDKSKKIDLYGKYIAYCGSMYTDKDGVPNLIQAFNHFCKSNNEVNLLLIGDNSNEQAFHHIKQLIDNSPYKHRIYCTGQIESDQMPAYLNNATMLALARPDNIQAKGGFPTKLGEYLVTGNPVVITAVGEHSLYLKDGVTAYLVRPGDNIVFGQRLLDAINDGERSKAIGIEGQKIALKYFNYKTQAEKLYNFLQSKQ